MQIDGYTSWREKVEALTELPSNAFLKVDSKTIDCFLAPTTEIASMSGIDSTYAATARKALRLIEVSKTDGMLGCSCGLTESASRWGKDGGTALIVIMGWQSVQHHRAATAQADGPWRDGSIEPLKLEDKTPEVVS